MLTGAWGSAAGGRCVYLAKFWLLLVRLCLLLASFRYFGLVLTYFWLVVAHIGSVWARFRSFSLSFGSMRLSFGLVLAGAAGWARGRPLDRLHPPAGGGRAAR